MSTTDSGPRTYDIDRAAAEQEENGGPICAHLHDDPPAHHLADGCGRIITPQDFAAAVSGDGGSGSRCYLGGRSVRQSGEAPPQSSVARTDGEIISTRQFKTQNVVDEATHAPCGDVFGEDDEQPVETAHDPPLVDIAGPPSSPDAARITTLPQYDPISRQHSSSTLSSGIWDILQHSIQSTESDRLLFALHPFPKDGPFREPSPPQAFMTLVPDPELEARNKLWAAAGDAMMQRMRDSVEKGDLSAFKRSNDH